MLIAVIADTHNQIARLTTAVEQLARRGANLFFHCGDITDPKMLGVFRGREMFCVRGNNDHFADEAYEAFLQPDHFLSVAGRVTRDKVSFAMTHGHHKSEIKRLLLASPDYLFLGHSHRRSHQKVGNTVVINPGALHRVKEYTTALIDTEKETCEFLFF